MAAALAVPDMEGCAGDDEPHPASAAVAMIVGILVLFGFYLAKLAA